LQDIVAVNVPGQALWLLVGEIDKERPISSSEMPFLDDNDDGSALRHQAQSLLHVLL